MDVAVPIVFPDYRIAVGAPATSVRIPDLLPWVDILPDRVQIASTQTRLGNLGHAGILIINGSTGQTRYYEYGRYDAAALGLVRRVPVPNVVISGGRPTEGSMRAVLAHISIHSGQRGRIEAAYVEVAGGYSLMLAYAEARQRENGNPSRRPYSIISHSCIHFVIDVLQAAHVNTPSIVDPRPNSYIAELRSQYPPLDYSPASAATAGQRP